MEKVSLKGFFTVRCFNNVLEIRDCSLHETDGREWISMPSRAYQKDGETKYASIVRFPQKKHYDQFIHACLDALQEYRKRKPENARPSDDDDIAF